MPGIVGLISRMPAEKATCELAQMLKAMQHDPSYVTGTHLRDSMGVYCAWTARGGSFASQMPVCSGGGEVALVFSGEEFPAPGMAGRLRPNGLQNPASYLPYLYEEDSTFPATLNGRFHGLLCDARRETAVLFNDRYGMQRIYYHQSPDAFYFAAEAKAILAVRPELRTLDLRGLGELVSCGCVLENRTLFEGIQVLPAASAWTFRNGTLETEGRYFDEREWEQQNELQPEEYYNAIREVFARNLPRYFEGREAVGVSLTGGLDSRMIMAWQKHAARTLPCYSFGGSYRECADVSLGRTVAEECGQTHQVIPVGQEFLSKFAHYAERSIYLTDGCVGVNHSPDLYVNERAARIAPVRMTGNYGGEVLRRVRAFKPMKATATLFAPEMASYHQAADAAYGRAIDVHPLSFAVFRQAPWHHYSLLALEQTQVSLRSPFLDNEFVKTVFRAPLSSLTDNDTSLRLIADGNPALGRIPTDRGLTRSGGMSRKLINQWIEFTVKAEYAYDYGMPQGVASIDHRLSGLHLERLFLGRHKFSHFRVWYRDALAPYVREILLDKRTLSRPFFDTKALEAKVNKHVRGEANHTLEIHKALSVELIHRLLLDS